MLDSIPPLASALTIEGAAGMALIIMLFIQALKWQFQNVDAQPIVLIASAVIVMLAFYDQRIYTVQEGFKAFVVWLVMAKISMGLYDEWKARPGSVRAGLSAPQPPSTGG